MVEGYYVLDTFAEYGRSDNRMHRIEDYAGNGQTVALQQLFAYGYSQAEIDTALENAIAYSQLETAEFLISLGADLLGNECNGVYYAVHNNELAGLQFAVANGVDINVAGGLLLNTTVETACNTKDIQIIRWLLNNGADKSLLTQRSIDLAARWGRSDLKALIGMPELPKKTSPWWKFWD